MIGLDDARGALAEAARQVLSGAAQPGQEDIHPEWQRFLAEISRQLVEVGPEQFTRLPIFAHTMFIGDYADTARQLNALRRRPDWGNRWRPALIESPIGGAPPSEIYPPSSGNQIRQAYILARFEDEMGEPIGAFDQIAEFGGGFGALCLLAHRLGFRGRYILVDNQPLRALQRWYLLANGLTPAPDGVLDGNGVCLLPGTMLEQALKDTPGRTAFLANWSLSETAPALRDRVFHCLRQAQADAIWVTYQKNFDVNNGNYFVSRVKDFLNVYDVSIRAFQPDARADDYWHGHACLALRRIVGRSFPAAMLRLEPSAFETSDMQDLSMEELLARMRSAIAAGRPFSALRLGDGEARIIGYPRYVERPEVSDIWQTWFGVPDFVEAELQRLRAALQDACLGADLIGLPRADADIESEFGRVKVMLPREGFIRRTTPLCHAGFHLGFYREGRYPALLDGVRCLGVIGPRDLTEVLPRLYGVEEVVWMAVPPEMKFSDLSATEKAAAVREQRHLAHRYEAMMQREIPAALERRPGLVVLVGAGLLGKIYCQRVKALGGIAIDVGSMMDVWAGLKTRDNQRFDGLRPVLA